MRYHVQENALFSAQNVTPAIQDTLQHMVQGDEAVLDWGFYTIGSPITIANATRLQYCTLTLHGEYTYTSSPAALQISADYFTFRMDRLTSHIASIRRGLAAWSSARAIIPPTNLVKFKAWTTASA